MQRYLTQPYETKYNYVCQKPLEICLLTCLTYNQYAPSIESNLCLVLRCSLEQLRETGMVGEPLKVRISRDSQSRHQV